MKKSNILAILSSPRTNGNSTLAAKAAASALGGKVFYCNISRLRFKPCSACGGCSGSFECVYSDAASRLVKKIRMAGTVIIAAPVYFTGVPGILKMFIDRNQCCWEAYRAGALNAGTGVKKHKNYERKNGIIILTAGGKESGQFKAAESEIRAFFAVNSIKTCLVMRFGGMDEKGAVKKYAAGIKAAVRGLKING